MTASEPLQRPAIGITCCVFGLLAFAAQDTLVKRLSEIYPVLEVVTVRTTMVLVILALLGLLIRGRRVLQTTHLALMLLRGCIAFMAFSSYYLALTAIPLADAAAVYMTAPLFVTGWSVLLLHERVGWHGWGAIGCGFAAAIIMLEPGAGVFRIAAALPLFSAVVYAAIPIITRRFGRHEHPLTMALYSIIGYLGMCLVAGTLVHAVPSDRSAVGLLATASEHWRLMHVEHLALALLAGGLFTLGLLGITQAYRVAAASVVAPFEYSYLLWATALGYVVFGDVPGARTIVCSAVVVACGCHVIYRQSSGRT